jgi:hypothetical protein
MTSVLSPIKGAISSAVPTPTILPPKTATASATSSFEFTVMILPPVITRSALNPGMINLLNLPPIVCRIQECFKKDALSLLERSRNGLEQNGIKREGTPKIFVFQDAITKCQFPSAKKLAQKKT